MKVTDDFLRVGIAPVRIQLNVSMSDQPQLPKSHLHGALSRDLHVTPSMKQMSGRLSPS